MADTYRSTESDRSTEAGIYANIEAEIPRLRRYARALARDATAADDLVQDCLARALGKLHLWQAGTDLRAWLFTILHNQYVNQVRRAVREGAAVGLSETEPMLTQAPHQGKRLELRDLDRAIARLPQEQRSVILLVGLEGMRYEEVAAVLDVPVGTVRSRLSRGREALRRLTGIVPDRQAEAAMAGPTAARSVVQSLRDRAGFIPTRATIPEAASGHPVARHLGGAAGFLPAKVDRRRAHSGPRPARARTSARR